MPSNMNLMQASKKLEHVKAEVRTQDRPGQGRQWRLELANCSSTKTLMSSKSMADWLAERYEEAEKLQREVNEYMKTEGLLSEL